MSRSGLSSLNASVDALCEMVNRAETTAAVRFSEWSDILQTVSEINAIQTPGDSVLLDVGGQEYRMARAVLLQDEDGLLGVIGADLFGSELDERGAVFIDRDPALFAHVLAALRWRPLRYPLWQLTEHRSMLRRELRYYNVPDLDAVWPLEAFDVLRGCSVNPIQGGQRYTAVEDLAEGEAHGPWAIGAYSLTIRPVSRCRHLQLQFYQKPGGDCRSSTMSVCLATGRIATRYNRCVTLPADLSLPGTVVVIEFDTVDGKLALRADGPGGNVSWELCHVRPPLYPSFSMEEGDCFDLLTSQ